MFALTEIAAKFARLDGVGDENHAQFLTSMRNLTQRHHLPPTEQVGRSFLYDHGAAVTIRLAQIAAEFGLPRTTIDTLSRWLSGSGERKEKQGSGWRGLSHAEEAIQRVNAGESFALHVVMRADRSVIVKADWKTDRDAEIEAMPDDKRGEAEKRRANIRQAAADIGVTNVSPEIARFSLPASTLIAEILPLLKA
ncbi:hypothetical protein [Paracoccus thiocyanatus]|uniref:Uncharacterized protein n=1 Tax=Paracoccus thiocyanatus TaxID=34006 RepID=A0A3D8PFX9_9RHOB|nr:hypothetical protein [Paracoccus thiocyanatus]RDW14105.1 hypothetical protein DIE28_04505 [Paracoccus thiocyanatus]